MIDIINYHLYGYPVFVYTLMTITAGALTYATVYSGFPGSETPSSPGTVPNSVAPNPPGGVVSAPPPAYGGNSRRRRPKSASAKKSNSSHTKRRLKN